MISSTVIGAGPVEHPSSGKDLMRVTVDHPYDAGGESYGATDIWGPRDMPEPQNGDPIAWDGHHIEFRGVRYPKPEYDSNPADPLH